MQVSREHFVSDEAFAEYERGINWFYSELVRLNMTIYMMEHISKFPFRLFSSSDDLFFSLVMGNFLDTAILIVSKIYSDDTRSGSHFTLLYFRRRLRELIKPEYYQELNQDLKNAKFDSADNQKLDNVKAIRNAYVAHLTQDFVKREFEFKPLNMSILVELQEKLNELFGRLALKGSDHMFMMLYLPYHPDVTRPGDSRPDIERILDDIARNSHLLNLPEQNPQVWYWKRKRIGEEDLQILNSYRKKFGLPEV